jgi:hypothetical protein
MHGTHNVKETTMHGTHNVKEITMHGTHNVKETTMHGTHNVKEAMTFHQYLFYSHSDENLRSQLRAGHMIRHLFFSQYLHSWRAHFKGAY